tara:strand:+ start:533 stop:898 length:366 start_codon:yes stop_codon:yes gene_type:complete
MKGIITIIITLAKDFNLLIFITDESKTLANKRAVENLVNSDGWNLKPSKLNQDVELLTSCPKNKTIINSKMDRRYNGSAKSKINLYSIIWIIKKTRRQIKIQINCLKDSFSKVKKEMFSEY